MSRESGDSNVVNLTNVNGTLYFSATNSVNGSELWKSDGTTTGTTVVKDIFPGAGSSNPQSLTNLNGWMVLSATDGISGKEAWISNGTVQGTQLLADVFSGASDSAPREFVQAGANLLYRAASAAIGSELWASSPFPSSNVSLANGIVTIDLSGSTSNRNLSVTQTVGRITVTDLNTSSEILGPNVDLPMDGIQQLRIIGSAAFSESITIDHSAGGVVSLPMGLEFDAGAGGVDTVSIVGAAGVDATITQTSTDLTITSGVGSALVPLKLRNVESLTITSMRRISVNGSWSIDLPITASHQSAFDLGAVTTLTGSTLTSSGTVALGSGELITGSGVVAGRFAGEAGSTILASGNMSLGNASSTAGFFTRGEIDVGTSDVTLLDANQAVLGALTTLGNATTSGNLNVANGALIDFGNNLVGYGTLNTPNLATKPTIVNGNVEGTSIAKPTTLTGYVKGIGSLNNVSITGTYSPGFSPAAVTLGSVSYAASSVTTIELGGVVPGTQHDQLNHSGQALLGGTLDLQLINSYQPVVGDSFTIVTATAGVVGSFANANLPTLPITAAWQILYSPNQVVVNVIAVNVAPSDIALSASTLRENVPAGAFIGSFNSTDANAGNTFVYSLVSGSGDTNNTSFSIDGTGALRNSSALNFETQGTYSIRVRTTDQGGLFTEKTFAISLIDLPELVGAPVFGDGTVQRSLIQQITVTFDGSITIGSGAISVNKRGSQGGAVTTNVSSSVNGLGQTIVQITFSGIFARGGALVDGYYELLLNGASLTRGAEGLDINQDGTGGDNLVMGANEADNFFALYGDTDGDGIVGVGEFGQFRTAFGKTSSQSGYDPRFDFEGDAIVGISDFGQFRSRFGKPRMVF